MSATSHVPEEPIVKCSVCGLHPSEFMCRQHFIVEAREQRERAERAEAVITMAGNWPQTVGKLEEALSTFPAGRAFLTQWTAEEKRASEAFARAHNAEGRAARIELAALRLSTSIGGVISPQVADAIVALSEAIK